MEELRGYRNRGLLVVSGHISVLDRQEYILRGFLLAGTGVLARCGGKECAVEVETLSETEDRTYGGFPVRVTIPVPEKLPGPLSVYARRGGKKILSHRIGARRLSEAMRGIQYSVDEYSVSRDEEIMRLMGWAVGRKPVGIAAYTADGKEMPCRLERYARYDAARMFDEYPVTLNCGYLLEFRPVPSGPVTVRMTCGGHSLDLVFRPTGAAARQAHLGRLFRKGSDTLLYQGPALACRKVIEKVFNPRNEARDYDAWIRSKLADAETLEKQRGTAFPFMPLVSVVIPLYNTPPALLHDVADSILGQSYPKIELCLADGSPDDSLKKELVSRYGEDPRIRYRHLERNGGISENTNAAIALASGEVIMLSDHDDTIEPDAVFEIVSAFNRAEDVDAVYTDEDKVSEDGKIYYNPHFKPDFNPDLLRSNNYICHIFAVRRETLEAAGLLRKEFDGAQDYDFILRCCEKARRIEHVPKVLYHWRAAAGSTAGNPESKLYAYEHGRDAVQAHYDRLGLPASASMTEYFGRYRTVFRVQGEPLVSVIIPNRDHREDLERTVSSLLSVTAWKNVEVLIVENGSTEEDVLAYYDTLREDPRIRILRWEEPFNYSLVNNYAAGEAEGEYLLFLNNDVEIIEPEWMTEMLGYCQRDDVGAVGAKLSYPDGTIQHVGIILGMGGAAGHMFYGWGDDAFTYTGRGNSTQDLSAVTAACMMTKKELFLKAGGFDPGFTIAFNDVDYCLKLREMGYLVVLDVYAHLVHYESASRGSDKRRADPERHARFLAEANRLRSRWPAYYEKGDPAFNPNLDLTRPDFAYDGQYPKEDHEAE